MATSTQISTDMFVTRSAVLRGAASWTQDLAAKCGLCDEEIVERTS